jgi:hypothetical protein
MYPEFQSQTVDIVGKRAETGAVLCGREAVYCRQLSGVFIDCKMAEIDVLKSISFCTGIGIGPLYIDDDIFVAEGFRCFAMYSAFALTAASFTVVS